jgi:hypothetical protein
MASPKTIPSKISGAAIKHEPSDATSKLFITALLKAGVLTIDGVGTISSLGPVNLSSPIICSSFTTTAAAQVTYYEG